MEENVIQPQKQKKHFKTGTFISGLLTLALSIALAVCLGITVVQSIQMFGDQDGGLEQLAFAIVGVILIPIMIGFVLICLMMIICYLVLGILMITSAFKDDKVFSRRRGFIIFTIVLDFVLIVLLLIIGFAIEQQLAFILVAVAMLVSAVLKIVELVLHKKRMKKVQAEMSQNSAIAQNQVNFDALKSESKSENHKDDASAAEIDKLEELRKAGLISDEEYNQRKNKK